MKSNMQAANMRRTNRRIRHQENVIHKIKARSYIQQRHQIKDNFNNNWLRILFTAFARFAGFFTGFFSSPIGALRSLNLLQDRTMGAKQHRGAGAAKLRECFPKLGWMVSTRDGRRV